MGGGVCRLLCAPPTATPPPNNPPPSGQTVDLHGTITAIDRAHGIITYRDNTGATWTVKVSASTQYPGVPYSQIEAGMLAEIQGQTTGGYNLLASTVDAHDN